VRLPYVQPLEESRECAMFFFDDYTDGNADEEDVAAGCVGW